jgi:hypothetical protein
VMVQGGGKELGMLNCREKTLMREHLIRSSFSGAFEFLYACALYLCLGKCSCRVTEDMRRTPVHMRRTPVHRPFMCEHESYFPGINV